MPRKRTIIGGRRVPLRTALFVVIFSVLLGGIADASAAEPEDLPVPHPTFFKTAEGPKEVAAAVEILLLITVLSLAPAILMMTTAFTRIVVVLAFLRRALATQSLPPDQIIMGMSLFLTFLVMGPTWREVYQEAWVPYLRKENPIGQQEMLAKGMKPIKTFMTKQLSRNDYKDVWLFLDLGKYEIPRGGFHSPAQIPMTVLAPAFMLNELKVSFMMGFLLFLPFLVIDIVVSSVLLSMGMMMLPPVMISLPFKILLFVLVDGWGLVVGGIVRSFG